MARCPAFRRETSLPPRSDTRRRSPTAPADGVTICTISGPVGAFSSTGTITIHAETATFAVDSGLDAAGPGVDVGLRGHRAPQNPLTVVFDAHPGSDPDAIPVVVYQSDDGDWDVRPATRDAQGRFTITTSSFSLNILSWANPLAWWRSLISKIASAAAGVPPR